MPDSNDQSRDDNAAPGSRAQGDPSAIAVLSPALPGRHEDLAEKARDYAKASSAANTSRAYAADWRHYNAWARRQYLPALPPDPQVVGLYIAAQAAGDADLSRKPSAVSTIERRLSALAWNFAQRGLPMDRKDRHIAAVLAGVRRTHARPPIQKEAVLPEDLIAMLATLEFGDLRGLRDRAILLLGFAGGLRRSEIVALDCGRDLPVSIMARCFAGSRIKARASARTASTTAMSPAWSSDAPSRQESGPTSLWRSERGNIRAIRSAPASPPPPRSTSATCKSSSATPPRK
jgi:site-specific recombinase XerC